ncbi:cell division protein SepF [Saccharomonospora sp. CUA-673]|uniref:cell division protein SepF n=1 Tax=Saccharomonospora sp. CUA-673 TaxID=1904969 RepID=UPI000966BA1A|nr:cell division protein SepF [Saccharomonospora sp. CUA-673]OLT48568.1 cell division protein SepF [Saccharomonospora sp. CUA-673]
MSTLHKLKAYFGMVPAEDEYYDDYRRGYSDGGRDPYDSYDEYADYDAYEGYERAERADYRDADYDEPPRRGRSRYHVMDEFDEPEQPPMRTRRPVSPAGGSGQSEASVHGSLAVDRQPEPVARLRPAPPAPEQPVRQPAAARDPLSRIRTLHPTSYTEAREIGEAYRDGTPVIINLTEMDNADAKRVVDFAAGLAFALRGSMDRVTNKVFLLSPPDVDVSAEDRRRIAEGGLFLRR